MIFLIGAPELTEKIVMVIKEKVIIATAHLKAIIVIAI